MKKLVLFSLLLSVTVCFSQIKKVKDIKNIPIGKIAPMNKLHISLEKSNNTYIFVYSDVKFSKTDVYKSFSFKDVDAAFENLYSLITEGLSNPPSENIRLELPNDIVELKFLKSFGIANVKFIHTNSAGVTGSSIWLTKKKIAKLFGKKYIKRKRKNKK